jgi:uncharacterized protein YggE
MRNEQLKKKSFFCVIVAVLCLAGCGDKRQSSISVSGMGMVFAQPDTVQMYISLSHVAATTRQAQEEVVNMVRQALKILQDSGVEEKNIQTASLRFMPEYQYGNSKRELLGQKAEQTIAFSVENLSGISSIIDQLIGINGIQLQQMQFSVKDNSALYARSRELAYEKARQKAEQYAKLSGMRIAGIVSISEDRNISASSRVTNYQSNSFIDAIEAAADGSTVLPTGQMEITSQVFIEFLLK